MAADAEYRPYKYARQRDPANREGKGPSSEMPRIMDDVFLNRVYGDELLAEVERDVMSMNASSEELRGAIAAALADETLRA